MIIAQFYNHMTDTGVYLKSEPDNLGPYLVDKILPRTDYDDPLKTEEVYKGHSLGVAMFNFKKVVTDELENIRINS